MDPDPKDSGIIPPKAFPSSEPRGRKEGSAFIRGFLAFLLSAFLIAAGSAALVWPLWALATRQRRAFAALAAFLVLSLVALAVLRRLSAARKGRREGLPS
jgi:hypothetical protein